MAMLVLGVAAFAICLTIVAMSPPAPPNVDFGDLLKKAPAMYKLSMGHLFDLTMGAMSVFRVPLILTGVGFLAGTFFNWLFESAVRRCVESGDLRDDGDSFSSGAYGTDGVLSGAWF